MERRLLPADPKTKLSIRSIRGIANKIETEMRISLQVIERGRVWVVLVEGLEVTGGWHVVVRQVR
jgi:hypothetical protein